MRRAAVHILRWIAGGVVYGLLEILWRGHTHWSMILLAAVLCIPLDLCNNYLPWEWPLWIQAVLGGLTITAAELLAGTVIVLFDWMDYWIGGGERPRYKII